MSSARMFLSIFGLAVFTAGATGCYDLSDPTGPRRDDFMQKDSKTEPQPVEESSPREEATNAPRGEVVQALEELDAPKPATMTIEDVREEEARKNLH